MNEHHSSAPSDDTAPPPQLRIEFPDELPALSPDAAATLLRILLKAMGQDEATTLDPETSPPGSAQHDPAQAGDR